MKVGLIGAGKLGGSLLARLSESDEFDIGLSDVHQEQLDLYSEKYGLRTTSSNRELVADSDLVIIAVKPWNVAQVLDEISPEIQGTDKAVASVAAGVTIDTISSRLPEGTRVLRVMPNVCASVGLGSAVVTANEAGQDMLPALLEIFRYVGEAVELPESLFDAATALHGSGPAYVALFTDALVQAGVREGIPRDIARKLVTGTLQGTAVMLKDRSPHQVRDEVMTPGGTTAAAFVAMERSGFAGAVYDGVRSATEQAREMGKS